MKPYSVTQINQYIRKMFRQDFLLRKVSVQGEISNLKYHTSGHIYFTLKDGTGTLAAVMFESAARNLRTRLSTGDHVVCSGQIEIYEKTGTYQLYVQNVEVEGEGDLYRRFLQNRERLEEIGYFATEYKKPIPRFAKKIGVVTASTGAAVRDIINISHRRNPFVQLILYSAIVQGDGAVPSIVNGIRALDRLNLDVLIVGRGGGSMEDLWAFNEEEVVKAVFECNTPVISAVGHETDTVLTDFAADLRAPTPSAAAELAVYDVQRLKQELQEKQKRMERLLFLSLEHLKNRVQSSKRLLSSLSPEAKLRQRRMQLIDQKNRLDHAILVLHQKKKEKIRILAERLHGKSPLLRLQEGYSFLSDGSGKQIRSVHSVREKDLITAFLYDGKITARVEETREEAIRGK